MANLTLPLKFDPLHDAGLLAALGYVHEFIPADWWDDGGPESGPHLSGHPDLDVYTLSYGTGTEHVIVVVAGEIVEAENAPAAPPGWFDEV